MATGGADVIELITCPVCRDIYTQPKSLRCRHTICKTCLDGLVKERRATIQHSFLIKCPVCRESCTERNIRDDFKVAEMVALFGAHVSLPENHLCEWCEKSKLRWRCTQCEAMICDDCKMVHEKVKMKGGGEQHEIKSVQELAEKLRSQLMESKNKTDSVLATAKHDLQEVRHYKAHLRHTRAQVLSTIEKEEKQQLDAIKAKFNSLRRQVHQSTADELTVTSYKENAVQAAITGATQKFTMLADDEDGVPQSMTDIVVNYGANTGPISMLSLSDQWHAPSPNVQLRYIPPDQSKPSSSNPEQQGLMLPDEANDAGKLEISRNFEPISSAVEIPFNFDDIRNTTWEAKTEITSESYCHSMCRLGKELWCAQFDTNTIAVYDTESGAQNRVIQCAMMEHPTCVIDTTSLTGRVLIGCSYDDGLHEVDLEGSYKQRVCRGSIADGCVYNDHVYALQHQHGGKNNSHVLEYNHDGTDWCLKREFELDYCRTSHNDSIVVTRHGIRISSWCNNSVFLYDFEGGFVRYEDMADSDPPPHPRLCQTDEQGDVLVTDSCHGKVYSLGNDKKWKDLDVPDTTSPRHAILYGAGKSLWILDNNGTRLVQYQSTTEVA